MNFNDYCWVRLTDEGRAIHRRLFDELVAAYPKVDTLKYEPPTEPNGWSRFQLWELMHDFGKYCYNGQMKLPFGTEVLFEEPTSGDAGAEPT